MKFAELDGTHEPVVIDGLLAVVYDRRDLKRDKFSDDGVFARVTLCSCGSAVTAYWNSKRFRRVSIIDEHIEFGQFVPRRIGRFEDWTFETPEGTVVIPAEDWCPPGRTFPEGFPERTEADNP